MKEEKKLAWLRKPLTKKEKESILKRESVKVKKMKNIFCWQQDDSLNIHIG
jgi:hypothetical protein